jgi:hypothetical protein
MWLVTWQSKSRLPPSSIDDNNQEEPSVPKQGDVGDLPSGKARGRIDEVDDGILQTR